MDVASAIAAISSLGLYPVVLYATSEAVPAGEIIPGSQSPAAGTVVTPGTATGKVFFTVSTGAPSALGNVTVPDLVGLSVQQAYEALAAASLSVDALTFASSSDPEGTVTAQAPASGESVPAATIVELTVSAGPTAAPDTVQVPSVS